MFLDRFFGKKPNEQTIDVNELLEKMTEDEIFQSGLMLFWKHDANLAATIAEKNENAEMEIDMSVLSWQFGRKKSLSEEEVRTFRERVSGYFAGMGQRVAFADQVDFFEPFRKGNRE